MNQYHFLAKQSIHPKYVLYRKVNGQERRENERENEIERGKMSAKGGNHMIKQKVTDC